MNGRRLRGKEGGREREKGDNKFMEMVSPEVHLTSDMARSRGFNDIFEDLSLSRHFLDRLYPLQINNSREQR